ncbi:MAG: hypothetical protein MUF02_01360 [Acidobacteria bacterium]|nr:hypothetical protein [Acidobacteriota bacterium]
MTEVTFFEDFHCFEYHTPQGAAQRFRYYLYSPVYERIPFFITILTQGEFAQEKVTYSSDFIPCRLARHLQGLKRTEVTSEE